MRIAIPLLVCVAVQATQAVPVAAAPLSAESEKVYVAKVKPFLQAHCVKCHDAKDTKAGFRIDTIETDFLAGKTADHWKEIYDKLGLGKMPPRKEPRPAPQTVAEVMNWINRELRHAEKQAKNSSGRIPTRRLNRTEYVNTLRDLFYLDDNFARDLEEQLPADGKVDGFDRGGASLFIDEAQLNKYLEVAEKVLSQDVFGSQPKQIKVKYLPREWRSHHRAKRDGCVTVPTWFNFHPNYGKPGTLRRVRVGASNVEEKKGGLEFLERSGGSGVEDPDGSLSIDQEGSWYGYADPFSSANFRDGRYRLKFRAGASKGHGARAVDDVKVFFSYGRNTPLETKQTLIINAPIHQPKDFETKVFLRAGSPDLRRGYRLTWNGATAVVVRNPIITELEREWNAEFGNLIGHLTNKKAPPAEIEEAKKKIEEFHQYYHRTTSDLRIARIYNPQINHYEVPRLWIESFEIEGPLGTWPPKGRTELFFAGEDRPIDKEYIQEIFARFLPRAFRRPVEAKEVEDWVVWTLKAQQASRLSGTEAVKEGVKAVLCSPGFLLINEPAVDTKPRKLTDYELATRLSYFLWSTMPDAELLALAADKKLHDPTTLSAQVRRMILDPKSAGLIHNFTGQWLKVRDFSSVITDRNRYRAYDDQLRDSSRREPYEFFGEILRKDLSILNFVDSDFLVIDERLAKHYGIDGVKGGSFRRVPIRPEHRRGGVLGMAGVMTFLSDGYRTLPVRRAAYVLDALWNAPPPPPPPNAGDLPPIKGKNLTVRQRLEQHRASAICASCHARIDPFGLALENYDAIGAWRERQNGEVFKGDKGSPPLDVSGVLPSGREFKSLQEFKEALLAEKERFVRSFVEKMLTYALGRSVGATDRETIAEIVRAVEPGQTDDRGMYRLQGLIQAIVSSDVFQMK